MSKHIVAFCTLISLLMLSRLSAKAQSSPPCSTQKVNGNCTLTLDRLYPITMPTIQARKGARVRVVVVNPLAFERLALNPQSAQAIVGTDQTASFLTSAFPNLKGLIITSKSLGLSAGELQLQGTADEQAVQEDLNALEGMLNIANLKPDFEQFSSQASDVNLQIQQVFLPLPASDRSVHDVCQQGNSIFEMPSPWRNYKCWRQVLICELEGTCNELYPQPPTQDLVTKGTTLLCKLPGAPSGSCVTPFDDDAFAKGVKKTLDDIGKLPPNQQSEFLTNLSKKQRRRNELAALAAPLGTAVKDLATYKVYIEQIQGDPSAASVLLGEIQDPNSAASPQAASINLLGRQVVFSIDATNQLGGFVDSVSLANQRKAITSVTVLFADPIFETSAGVFFSSLPNRSFANQTVVTESPGGVATPGNIAITRTITRPTILPFVAANWRLGHDFILWHRRSAFYLTGAVALNPYNTLPEFGAGPSLSWRSIMFSILYHEGHDIRLTQGEFVGEIWCNSSAAVGQIPKCSGSPPSPSTERFWTGAVALGVSVRVPTVFGSTK